MGCRRPRQDGKTAGQPLSLSRSRKVGASSNLIGPGKPPRRSTRARLHDLQPRSPITHPSLSLLQSYPRSCSRDLAGLSRCTGRPSDHSGAASIKKERTEPSMLIAPSLHCSTSSEELSCRHRGDQPSQSTSQCLCLARDFCTPELRSGDNLLDSLRTPDH